MADPTRSRVPVLAGYLLPLLLLDWFYPRRQLPESAPGIAQLVGEIVCLLVLYDVSNDCSSLLVAAKHYVRGTSSDC